MKTKLLLKWTTPSCQNSIITTGAIINGMAVQISSMAYRTYVGLAGDNKESVLPEDTEGKMVIYPSKFNNVEGIPGYVTWYPQEVFQQLVNMVQVKEPANRTATAQMFCGSFTKATVTNPSEDLSKLTPQDWVYVLFHGCPKYVDDCYMEPVESNFYNRLKSSGKHPSQYIFKESYTTGGYSVDVEIHIKKQQACPNNITCALYLLADELYKQFH